MKMLYCILYKYTDLEADAAAAAVDDAVAKGSLAAPVPVNSMMSLMVVKRWMHLVDWKLCHC